MRSEIIFAGLIVAASVLVARSFELRANAVARPAPETRAAPVLAPATAAPTATHDGYHDIVRIAASTDHQFYVDAAVNRADARFLVDTGAGFVALREEDARRAGIYPSWDDFNVAVRTANGDTKAARVKLEDIEIGPIRVQNVDAFILRDDQLSINLLGMSFLSRLDSVEARAGELVLRG